MFGFFKKKEIITSRNETSIKLTTDVTFTDLSQTYLNEIDKLVKMHEQNVNNINIRDIQIGEDEGHFSAKEILFLWYIDGIATENPNIGKYWTINYNLQNFQQVIKKFFRSGLLKISDYIYNINKCKIPELKAVLQSHNVSVSGKKPDLVQRILDNIDVEEIQKIFNKSYFRLTVKGEKLIKQYEHILYYHNLRNVLDSSLSIETIDEYYKKNPNLSTCELFIQYHKQKASEYYSIGKYGHYRNAIFAVGHINYNNQFYEKAMDHLFIVCYYDMSGLNNSTNEIEKYKDSQYADLFYKSLEERRQSLYLAPGIIDLIRNCMNKLKLNISEVHERYESILSDVKIDNSCYSKKELWELINAQLS